MVIFGQIEFIIVHDLGLDFDLSQGFLNMEFSFLSQSLLFQIMVEDYGSILPGPRADFRIMAMPENI